MNAVEINHLTKFYGKSRGVTDLNLSIPEGDFFGFIGPNGAGKSTTIRTLLGLIAPTDGSTLIFGKDIRRNRKEQLADIGYMPSEASFYANMKVRDIIKYSAELRKRDCAAKASALCDRLELDTNKKISELSLGNRKKVSIVCALQHEPKLCILDEPTSGLDPIIQQEFFAILTEINKQGATIFLSSHILSEIQKYCRHAAIIRAGKLLLCERIENLTHTNAKNVTISGVSTPPNLSNIRNVKIDGDTVSFIYSGEPKALMNALAQMPLTDVNISEPDLEEIIMHYYKEKNDDNS